MWGLGVGFSGLSGCRVDLRMGCEVLVRGWLMVCYGMVWCGVARVVKFLEGEGGC